MGIMADINSGVTDLGEAALRLKAENEQLRALLERTLGVLSAASVGVSCRMAAGTLYNETRALLKAVS